MAAANYHDLLAGLQQIFEGDPRTRDARVFVEEDPQFDLIGAQKCILLVLNSRIPTGGQPIAAGKRTRWNVKIGVWACGFGISFEQAAQIRDELVGQIEVVLMANRTIRDKVATSWLDGGEFVSVRNEQHMFASAETILVAEVTAANG